MDITDQDVVGAVMFGDLDPGYAFEIRGCRMLDDSMVLLISDRLGFEARLRVPLPRTGRDQYWVDTPPKDAKDWASQLFRWIEEEVRADGLWETRARVVETIEGFSMSYVIAEPYGWRVKDVAEHERLVRRTRWRPQAGGQ